MSAANGVERLSGRRLAVELTWKDGLLSGLDIAWRKPEAVYMPERLESPERPKMPESLEKLGAPCSDWGERLRASLLDMEDGRPAVWSAVPLDWSCVSHFRRKVMQTLLERVGWGHLTTYGELANLSGNPGAARAVGGIMGANPWSLVVP